MIYVIFTTNKKTCMNLKNAQIIDFNFSVNSVVLQMWAFKSQQRSVILLRILYGSSKIRTELHYFKVCNKPCDIALYEHRVISHRYSWYCVHTTDRRHKCVNKYETIMECLKKHFVCETTSLRHGLKSPLLIRKHYFRTRNEGTLSCFFEILLYYCIKSPLYYGD